jgi:hypothetical protein
LVCECGLPSHWNHSGHRDDGPTGIISFVKGGVKELAIARPNQFQDLIVYKHPDKTVPMNA